ncbi:carbamoyl-phosphate synthase large subunit [Paenibacillus sambharensis]|uniref:Carbamoyl-phosphate synthase large subunit n=1 Tax=Paenibacillus sambharensis TaxID=1803190 RepID=A0A2W1LZB5_9BACL|nr:ATP-grasp domain-containing protein [Paenibacillus sambharensis]PZD97021.1 carbamoyl-phosphate synthase large subunit [Paenibacillus sambharensis]
MTRIYFNRWFSVMYHYIRAIRENPDGEAYEFYGTHPNLNHMSLLEADYKETEPSITGLPYVEYCAEFCRRHQIDVFIPRLHMEDIVRHIHLFDEIGTRVMVCRDMGLLEAMLDKRTFYEAVSGRNLVQIPAYEVVQTADQFREAYERLAAAGHNVCFKPTKSEGGMGFRIVNNTTDRLAELYGYVTLSTTFEDACRTLASVSRFDDLMVMEHLEGPEYSIDCVADAEGGLLVSIPRRKAEGRVYMLEDNPELQALAKRIANELRIPYAYNIQIRYNKGVPKLLEINPRMSGGLFISCLSGVNMPYLAVRAVLGKPVVKPQPRFGIKAGYIEQPLIMD